MKGIWLGIRTLAVTCLWCTLFAGFPAARAAARPLLADASRAAWFDRDDDGDRESGGARAAQDGPQQNGSAQPD
ncbi:MAG: hypothetical protein KAI24_15700, partial [Planctomycetes bacterium]|nr:hypothetical protein [Planctomycetota bacterium]